MPIFDMGLIAWIEELQLISISKNLKRNADVDVARKSERREVQHRATIRSSVAENSSFDQTYVVRTY